MFFFSFITFQLKPLYDSYQNDVNTIISEPLNTFWAECYESCKLSSQKRAKLLTDSRRRFQVCNDCIFLFEKFYIYIIINTIMYNTYISIIYSYII